MTLYSTNRNMNHICSMVKELPKKISIAIRNTALSLPQARKHRKTLKLYNSVFRQDVS